MKFKLKTLFGITVLVALIVFCFSSDRLALNEVRRLKSAVADTLVEMDGLNRDNVSKSEYRNEFVLFSSGKLNWEVALDDQSKPIIELSWKSRVVFSEDPSITMTHSNTSDEQKFVEKFTRLIGENNVGVTVVKNGG